LPEAVKGGCWHACLARVVRCAETYRSVRTAALLVRSESGLLMLWHRRAMWI